MHLKVLSIAFPFAPVSPQAVGGAEQVLSSLDQELCAAGHTSLVLACEGSAVSGTLFPFPLPSGEIFERGSDVACRRRVQAVLDHILATHRVDVIHLHGLDFASYTIPATIPWVATLHMPIAWYDAESWSRLSANAHLCCVSETQRLSAVPAMRRVCVIANGVALPSFPTRAKKHEFALVMGRICPEKNAAAALKAGTLARTRVLLAGQVFPYREHRQYFDETIVPLLQGAAGDLAHTFLGPLASGQRQAVIAEAKCLLHPTLAPETSSLVVMEAMAAGTPVIAYRSGALPEIVEDGVTGFLVDDVEEMAAAMQRVGDISPAACRRRAERRFARQRMASEYFDLYRSMLQADRRPDA